MPQVFQVLKCYKCSVFQIHQTKKSNKFECKMCGEKQSIKRHYGIGTGKDCRLHVQKLNVLRGNKETKVTLETDSDEENEDNKFDEGIPENVENSDKFEEEIPENVENSEANSVKRSKWSAFIHKEKEKEREITEEPMFLGDKEVFLELPRKTKAKIKSKVKTSQSEKHLNPINNFEGELKSDLEYSFVNNIDSNKSTIPVNDIKCTVTTNSQNKLTGTNFVNNHIMEKSLEKQVVLQTVNKNSRWAQYVNMEDDLDTQSVELSSPDSKECISNSDNLFSLCDDNDLDQILNI